MAQEERSSNGGGSASASDPEVPQEYALRLLERREEAEDVVSFHFSPDRPIDFVAGQYLHYSLPHEPVDERGNDRYFTIASAPSELSIMLATRIPEGGSSFKQRLARLEPGDVIRASDPGGRFVYVAGERQLVFIAAGIGVTPLRSMLIELIETVPEVEITLLYANRTPDIAFKPLFDALVQVHPNFRVVYIVSQPTAEWDGATGRIDADFIAREVTDLTTPLFYVSGPQPMVKTLAQTLTDLGVPRNRVKREQFPGYDD
jgi:ferredoxin-NADP reductase